MVLQCDPSMSAEQMPCEQRVLNKTIEQKMNSPSVYWTKQQLNNCRLNTEQNHLNKSLIERYAIEQFHYWTVLIWTLPRNQLNNVLIEQISIEHIWQWLGFIVVSINCGFKNPWWFWQGQIFVSLPLFHWNLFIKIRVQYETLKV